MSLQYLWLEPPFGCYLLERHDAGRGQKVSREVEIPGPMYPVNGAEIGLCGHDLTDTRKKDKNIIFCFLKRFDDGGHTHRAAIRCLLG